MENKVEPLYKQISDDLIQKIASGDFSYDEPLCTEKSLSEQYNVSRITAKRAIEELERAGLLYRKRGVGSLVARRETSGKLHVPSPSGGRKATRTIALMIPFSITKGGIFRAIEVATDLLSASGCYLTLHVYEPNDKSELSVLENLEKHDVDGLIYYPATSQLPVEILDRFVASGKPVITLDKPHQYERYSSIVCDNYRGGYLLTEHLVSYGHKRICYLSRFPGELVGSIEDRFRGCTDCLRDNGLESTAQFQLIDNNKADEFDYPMLKHIINQLHRSGVTAIECENDEVAFNVHMCCRSLSIRIPEAISITGFDNIDWATMGSAQITSIEQDFPAIGRAIAEIIQQPDYTPVHKLIPVRLIPRRSTGSISE